MLRLLILSAICEKSSLVFSAISLLAKTGAGAASLHYVDTVVLEGIKAVTLFTIFFAPLFHDILQELLESNQKFVEEEKCES